MKQSQNYNFPTSSQYKQKKQKIAGNFRYKQCDILGIGALGTVYLAHSTNINDHTQYALKKMNKYKIQSSSQSLQKFESQVLSLLKSTFIRQIISIIDFFKTKSSYYIITQYLQQSYDLLKYMNINRKKFCQLEVKIIWYDLLIGIGKLHKIGICHRDIKLQNVLYMPKKKQTKIIDFGMAHVIKNNQQEQSENSKINNNNKQNNIINNNNKQNKIIGSPMFISPQIINHQPYTCKCDIWSLGIVFYFMIYGKSPYKQANSIKAIKQKLFEIKNNNFNIFDDNDVWVSEKCKEVIKKCLKYEENERGQIEQILEMDFFNKNIKKQDKLINQLQSIQELDFGFKN